jgi:putative membrane protein
VKNLLTIIKKRIIPSIALSVALGSSTSYANTLDDASIIAIYNQVNSMDIETALIGQIMGHSSEVRGLAKMVSQDHSGVRQAVHALAKEIGVIPTLPAARASAAKNHYDVIANLRSQSNKAFDSAYLKHEIAFHQAAISAVKQLLLPSAQSPKLKEHFRQVLPHFEHHLNETIRIAKKLNIK